LFENNKLMTRTIFIVDRSFQLKYSIFFAAIGVLICLIMAGHVFYFVHENFDIFLPNYKSNPNIMKLIMDDQKKIAIYLGALSFMLVSFMFFIGILITHRVAGPVMVVRRKMDDLANGDFNASVHLRNNDEFKELADSFNNMVVKLRERVEPIEKNRAGNAS
jgi:nitrogen fixation/metabolism regulation signal transduction histidine kinase